MSRKLLLITAFWSPVNHVATNRAVAFAKYFKKAGFDVVILTTSEGSEASEENTREYRVVRLNCNHFLNRVSFQSKSSFVVHKIKALKNKLLNKYVADDLPGFYETFLKQQNTINFKEFDYILSSYAPLSVHKIALDLKLQNPKLKWIADFRDEMSFLPGLSNQVHKSLRNWEKNILSHCDMVTSVSQPLLEQFKSIHEKNNFLEVRNGFDFSLNQENEKQQEIFKIVYAGTFHGAMNPDLFLQALVLFKAKFPQQKIALDFYSGTQNFKVPVELEGLVTVHEKVAYKFIPEILSSASLLFLVHAITTRKGVFSGKIFDYLAVNRPILALVDSRGVAAELINKCNAGYVYPLEKSDSALDLAQFFEQILKDWQQNQLPTRNWDLISQQSREKQISKLISEINVSM